MNLRDVTSLTRGPALATALLFALAGPAPAYHLAGSVVGNGATPANGITGTAHAIRGTLGQPVLGISGNATWTLAHGFWIRGGPGIVGVPGADGTPVELAFGPATPNPARADVHFALALPRAARVRLVVLDAGGRVANEAGGILPAGRHALHWTCANRDGRRVSPGVYFARLLVDGRAFAVRRIVLLQ